MWEKCGFSLYIVLFYYSFTHEKNNRDVIIQIQLEHSNSFIIQFSSIYIIFVNQNNDRNGNLT